MRINIIVMLFVLHALTSATQAQLNLHFNLRETAVLRGNQFNNLTIEDVNNDGTPDYAYRTSDSIIVIDGENHETITAFPILPGTTLLKLGDLNNDNYKDIAIAGCDPAYPLVNYIVFLIAPQYTEFTRIEYNASNDTLQFSTSQLSFDFFADSSRALIGVMANYYLGNHSGGWQRISGYIYTYVLRGNSFYRVSSPFLAGYATNILPIRNGSTRSYIISTRYIETMWDPYGQWRNRRKEDLFSLRNYTDTTHLWHTPILGPDFCQGSILSLLVDSPEPESDPRVFFINKDQFIPEDSLICIATPSLSFAWKSGTGISHPSANLFLNSWMQHNFYDLWVFVPSYQASFQIRNPYENYVFDVGALTGAYGTLLKAQINNNVGDDLYYLSHDSVNIFNIIEQTDIDENSSPFPDLEANFANYPNPFNNETSISFNLFNDSWVVMQVYDILGRQRIVLLNQYMEKGTQKITLNAEGLSSGVYFLKLDTGEYSIARCITLIK